MIKFRCKNCNRKMGVPSSYAGKKVKCSCCNSILMIPSFPELTQELSAEKRITNNKEDDIVMLQDLESEDNISEDTIPQTSLTSHQDKKTSGQEESSFPKWLLIFFMACGVFFLIFLLYVFVFRNTWETDNYKKIYDLANEGSDYSSKGYMKEAIARYEELFDLVGDNTLKTDRLKSLYAQSQEDYERLSSINKTAYQPLLICQTNALSLLDSSQYSETISFCRETLNQYNDNQNIYVRPLLEELRKIENLAQSRLEKAIYYEKNVLMPRMTEHQQKLVDLGSKNQWDQVFVLCQEILNSQPEHIYTEEFKQSYETIRMHMINAKKLPGMVELFRQAYEYSQMNQWNNAVIVLDKLIDMNDFNETTPEIDNVIRLAKEQHANAKELIALNKRRQEEERELQRLQKMTQARQQKIITCPYCNGSGNKDPRFYTQTERYQMSAAISANRGGGFSTFSIPCDYCYGKGKVIQK